MCQLGCWEQEREREAVLLLPSEQSMSSGLEAVQGNQSEQFFDRFVMHNPASALLPAALSLATADPCQNGSMESSETAME